MIGTLYAGVVGLLVLLFQYINVAFPDVLAAPYAAVLERIRSAEAVLLVVTPVFLFLSWLLERDMAREPVKRDSRIRKWLIYFTLFLSAVTIIVDLIILIYNFLGGELRAQFFLKIAAVLGVAAAVFGYYFWELKRAYDAKTLVPRYAGIGTAAVVLAAVIAGFFIVGSPAAQRARRFDAERVSHLQMLQSGIMNYWIYKDELPKTQEDLTDDITGFASSRDPETGEQYEYRATGLLSFELCAVFKTDAAEQDPWHPKEAPIPLGYPDAPSRVPAPTGNDIWSHPAGRHCFPRTIDPAFYRPKPEKPVFPS